jgi:hypothetical protein
MGKLSAITFLPVKAQSVEVTALSMPPEMPITKPSVFDATEYALSQLTI